MGYLGRRIGKSQDTATDANNGDGGGILDLFSNGYFQRQGNIYNAPGSNEAGIVATGGVISDYTDSGTVYRAHIFTSSGTFQVTALGTFGDNIDYLVIGGGGGGGNNSRGGGGGAGGLRSNFPTIPSPFKTPGYTAEVASYAVTVGAGGAGGINASDPAAPNGGFSRFGSPGTNPVWVYASGGGGGGTRDTPRDGAAGGSGGGGGSGGSGPPPNGGSGGATQTSPDPLSPAVQGFAGGSNEPSLDPNYGAGGGGGAGGVGEDGSPSVGGDGGAGLQVLIAGPEGSDAAGVPGPGGQGGWFAGGGGGGAYTTPNSAGDGGGPGGPYAGGGQGQDPAQTVTGGTAGTGGGGGGMGTPSQPTPAPNGGSGIVVVRYKIATVNTNTAKATGGAISFYGGKTIHTFTGSGTFATEPNWSAADVEYVVVGGGGGGGVNEFGGGGGAGAYRTGTTPIGAHPVSTTIQVGGGGNQNKGVQNPLPAVYQGTPSYFGTPITSPGGGGGAVDDGASPFPSSTPGEQGMPGGSGGGNALDTSGLPSGGPATGSPFPGTIGSTPTSGWGHPGGKGSRSPIGGAGGGGAGGAGGAPATRVGGAGIQLPTTFRDPAQQIGAPGPTSAPTPNGFDTSGKYWVAGGGAGGGPAPTYSPTNGAASSGGGGYWSTPGSPTRPNEMIGAVQNTGSGGGSGGPGSVGDPQAGASGIVLIAYPT